MTVKAYSLAVTLWLLLCNFLIILYFSRIIVSAPNGTAINAAVNNTGVLFSCPVEQGSCIPLTGNGTGHDRRLYDVDGAYIKFIFMIMLLSLIL